MCGLVGIISKRSNGFFTQDQLIFKEMLYADALRGWDATGAFGVNKHGNVDIIKSAVPAGAFLQSKEYAEFNTKLLNQYYFAIGHNRKATHGQRISENSHPFWSSDENIVLVHNGMISNHTDLSKGHDVDSKALCEAISRSSDVLNTLQQIEGAYALIWYNVEQKTLFLCRNDSRPLTLTETDGTLILASEGELPNWILKRNKSNYKKQLTLPANTLYKIVLGKNELIEVGKIEKKTQLFIQQPHYTNGTGYTTSKGTPPAIHATNGATTKNPTFDLELNDYNEINETAFTTDADLVSNTNLIEVFPVGQRLFFKINNYIEQTNKKTGEILYELQGTPINIKENIFKVRILITKPLMDQLDLTKIHSGKVTLRMQSNNLTQIRVCHICEHDFVVAGNNKIIPDHMWYSECFPDGCSVCKTKISYKALTNSAVIFKSKNNVSCLCPTCKRIYQKED